MKFSAKKFRRDKRYGKLLNRKHLDRLDGVEVIDEQIDYEVDGEKFYLYPVLQAWCEEEL